MVETAHYWLFSVEVMVLHQGQGPGHHNICFTETDITEGWSALMLLSPLTSPTKEFTKVLNCELRPWLGKDRAILLTEQLSCKIRVRVRCSQIWI